MTGVEQAWARWLDVLRGHGFGIDAMLRPPVDPADLDAAGQAVGIAVPEQVAALLRLADGQHPLRAAGPQVSVLATNAFPSSEFLSLERAVDVWRGWADIRRGYTPDELRTDFDAVISVRPGDHVHGAYTHPAWWPFAEDGGGNALWVDTDPPPGGVPGQVIVAGPDEDERRVLAPDLAAYLGRLAAADLEPPGPDALADGIAWWDAPDLR